MKNTIKKILGNNWFKLHPNIQRRFSQQPQLSKPIIYKCIMQNIICSKTGWLFALITRTIGNPLTPYQGKNIPLEVKLLSKKNQNGVYWQRTYQFKNKKPYTVESIKKEEHGQMMECVGTGFGMYLDVYAQDQELHFKSSRYFWEIFGFYLPLPHWLSPGQTHVIHQDLGDNKFRFSITMKHSILGQTFFQTGVFHESK